jgi:anaphase-promoting complex subunit 2
MLTSLDSMPTDRIQQMLGFAPGYDRTLEQLGGFMEALRREGVVERSAGGDWSLMKTS